MSSRGATGASGAPDPKAASSSTLERIEERLGFVPPFFGPAFEDPAVLDNLWHQTETAYLDNPLPALFKERLAALMGRYCEVPYCLVCHTCSLRPLGVDGPSIVELLAQSHPSDEQVGDALVRVDSTPGTIDIATLEGARERDVFCLASAVYAGGPISSAARSTLRRRLSPPDYRSLIVLTSYTRMCHEWVAAHPEISFDLDQRYLQNHTAIQAEAPILGPLFTPEQGVRRVDHLADVATARASEASSLVALSDLRFADVLASWNERITAATERASANDALATQLRQAAAFAQELLAIVSHDLRNPLSNVLMGAQIILGFEGGDPRVAGIVRRVISSARRAQRMIHDLLDFSQARAGGGIPIHPRPLILGDVVRAAADEIRLAHPGRDVSVRCPADEHGEWDGDRLGQVLSNLLGNAIAHGRADAPIELGVDGDAEGVTIVVHNENRDGPIPEDLLPVLFDPFRRGLGGVFSTSRSIGLGLYIVDLLVRGHHGRVEVASSRDGGTTFRVYLPRSAATARPALPTAPDPSPSRSAS